MYMEAPAYGRRIELAAFAQFADLDAIEAAVVRAIVRGEQAVAALNDTTIRISANRIHRSGGTPASAFAAVRSADLAEGLLNLKDDAGALSEWARFILLTTEMFAFEDRHSEACDRLIGAIWELAFGIALRPGTVRLAQSVSRSAIR